MIKRFLGTFSLVSILFLLPFSCKKEKNQIDISTIEVNVPVYRFDEILTQKHDITKEQWEEVKTIQPEFADVFSSAILGDEQNSWREIQQFKHYFDSTRVTHLVKEEFAKFPEAKEFINMQKRVKALFPDFEAIGVTTMISGFNYKNIMLDNQLAVGLEMYLGDSIEYSQLGNLVNDYQVHRFHRSYIVPDATTAIISDIYPDRGEYNTFLKRIIFEGKKLYLKEMVLPDQPKEVLLGLQPEAYQWCVENEKLIWQYFITEELLYSNDMHRWKTYVFDGPFSAGMPEEAPAQTGNFIGWQIIKRYMAENKNVTAKELLENKDVTTILKQAKYAP